MIVIAHRLSTVINCEKMFVMKNGKILEIGNHEALIQKRGFYYELVQKQMHKN